MPAIDRSSGVESPASNAFAMSVGDLPTVTRAVYIGVAGNLVCTLQGDTVATTFIGVTAGSWLPIRVKTLGAATTATDLVGLY